MSRCCDRNRRRATQRAGAAPLMITHLETRRRHRRRRPHLIPVDRIPSSRLVPGRTNRCGEAHPHLRPARHAAAARVKQRFETARWAAAKQQCCIFQRPVMFHERNVKNGSKDLKRYPQISRRVRDTLARLHCTCAALEREKPSPCVHPQQQGSFADPES